jgi:hypothetical protein
MPAHVDLGLVRRLRVFRAVLAYAARAGMRPRVRISNPGRNKDGSTMAKGQQKKQVHNKAKLSVKEKKAKKKAKAAKP